MKRIATQSRTLFDLFPPEILFHIFDYLSNNDIIYTFFLFNQRLNNFLLENQQYLNYFELAKRNLNFWKDILSQIGSQIQTLNITSVDTSFPLTYFPNVKSLIVSSPQGFPDEELQIITNSDLFFNLHSFQIQQIKIVYGEIYEFYDEIISQDYLLEKLFNNQNCLKTFHYLLEISPLKIRNDQHFKINFNLKSLTIILTDFKDIYTLLLYTPNLEYLYLLSDSPYRCENLPHNIDVQLKKLSLELYRKHRYRLYHTYWYENFDFNQFMYFIQLFSSSLIYLSLHLTDLRIEHQTDFPFNGFILRQSLETMRKLEQLHFIVGLYAQKIDNVDILSTFNDQFWLDHNWSFGTYNDYLFTLPFHFTYLDFFYKAMNQFRTNNLQILANNQKLWSSIKSIQLPIESKTDSNLLKDIQRKLPHLNTIEFAYTILSGPDVLVEFKDKDLRLNTVTKACLHYDVYENAQDWLIYILTNLKSLTIDTQRLPRIENKFIPILNNKIDKLEIVVKSDDDNFKQLIKEIYTHFSNLQYLDIHVMDIHQIDKSNANILIEILENLTNLKALLVYNLYCVKFNSDKWNQFVQHITVKQLYRVKTYERYVLFINETLQNI